MFGPHAHFAPTACVWEACARKVGNVHRHRDFAGTSLTDFLISAAAIGPVFATDATVGQMILRSVSATRSVVGQNTNLGIVLALAPLARCRPGVPLRSDIGRVLAELTVADAAEAYDAIRIANPGGLGSAESQDVADAPTVTLLDAMRLAAGRDRIAGLYATGFAEVFDEGIPAFREAMRHGSVERAAIETHLRLLAAAPDSLIARKCGEAVAADVSRRAAEVLATGGLDTAAGRAKGRELDVVLRSDGHRRNPGTTADLVAAVLYVALRERIVTTGQWFPWAVEDWL